MEHGERARSEREVLAPGHGGCLVAHQQHSSGGWQSECRGQCGQVLVRASSGVQTSYLLHLHVVEKETNSLTWSRKGTDAFMKTPSLPSGPNSLPTAHLQNHHSGRDTHIQSHLQNHHSGRHTHIQSVTQGHNWWEICLMRNILIICVQQTTPKLV